jgi:ABC-type Na+ transport system ATPase subunit NatA
MAGTRGRAVPAAIEVSHPTKVFGGRTAVSDVSFSVAGGELFGFLGPNGAGKTTTALAIGLAAALLAIDLLAWRVVAAMFDRERLVTGRPG